MAGALDAAPGSKTSFGISLPRGRRQAKTRFRRPLSFGYSFGYRALDEGKFVMPQALTFFKSPERLLDVGLTVDLAVPSCTNVPCCCGEFWVPPGSVHKGGENVPVRDQLSERDLRSLRKVRWVSPAGSSR